MKRPLGAISGVQSSAASSNAEAFDGVADSAAAETFFTSKAVVEHGEQSGRKYCVGPLCKSIFDAASIRRRAKVKLGHCAGEILHVCIKCSAFIGESKCTTPSERPSESQPATPRKGPLCDGPLCKEAEAFGGKRNPIQTALKFQRLCKRCYYSQAGNQCKNPSGRSALVKSIFRRIRLSPTLI